jgi:ABC-type polysaccharide/polyol phosphate export permease
MAENAGRNGMAMTDRRKLGHTSLSLVLYVARRDLARRYAGSMLGAAWVLAFPVLQIGVYWAVASYGLRLRGSSGAALGPLLIAGMTPWFALSDALGAMTRSFTSNAALLKRLVVPPAIMPLASLAGALMIHVAILVITILALWALGHPPAPSIVLLIYFAGCGAVFALACGTLLALANAALRDIGQVLGPLLLLWFWATPIIWPTEALPERLRAVVTWNPLAYLVDGYRFALLGSAADLPSTEATIAFWTVTALLGLVALLAFGRFKREVADFL